MEGILYLICPSHWGPTSAPSFNVPNNIILSKLLSSQSAIWPKNSKICCRQICIFSLERTDTFLWCAIHEYELVCLSIRSIHLQHNFSKAANLLLSAFWIVQVSTLQRNIRKIRVRTSCILMLLLYTNHISHKKPASNISINQQDNNIYIVSYMQQDTQWGDKPVRTVHEQHSISYQISPIIYVLAKMVMQTAGTT